MSFKTTKLQPFGLIIEPISETFEVGRLDLAKLRELFDQHHLIVLRGFRTFKTSEEFSDYCETWGEISLWPFGKVLELIEQANPEDHIFDNNYVPMHWDGMYRPKVPEMQIFHCMQAPDADHGGGTTFANTALAIENASSETRNLWSQATGVYERKMEFYHSKTEAPVIAQHPYKDYSVIRYCEPPKANDENFVNHPNFEFTGVTSEQASELMTSLRQALYAPENFLAHKWQTGDIVISDNHTLLHGREAFTSGAPRHIQRVHILGNPGTDNPHLVFHS